MGIITIAFDDGYKETFETCAGYLKENNIRATFAVPAAFIGKTLENKPVIGRDQILSLLENGSEIASHTKSHLNLLDLFNAKGEEAVRSEMSESKNLLRSSLEAEIDPSGTEIDSMKAEIDSMGIEIDSMVFPFIEANQNPFLRSIAADYYSSSRITTENMVFNRLPVEDPFSIMGVAFTRNIPIREYNKLIDIACKYDFWLIEVFHYVSDKNTKSAHRNEPYKFFTHIDDFKSHMQYILSKNIPVLTQKEVIQKYTETKKQPT